MKVWAKIDDCLDTYTDKTVFDVTIEGVTVFQGNDVFDEIDDHYSEWSFLTRQTETPSEKFLKLYRDFIAETGYQWYRMNDALTREYNPINNYEMIESGVDGHKMSKRTLSSSSDKETTNGGTITTTSDDSHTGTNTNKRDIAVKEEGATTNNQTMLDGKKISDDTATTTGSVDNDEYNNGFNSGATDVGTHVRRTTTTNNELKTANTRAHNQSATVGTNTVTDADEIDQQYLNATGSTDIDTTTTDNTTVNISENMTGQTTNTLNTTLGENATASENETYANDVSLSYNKATPDGSQSEITLGNNFSDGTMHEFTRSGNIGVTTSAQMISGELALRKVNLLADFVSTFIDHYCTLKQYD